MRPWKHSIDIKTCIGAKGTAQESALRVLKELKKLERHFKEDFEYEQIAQEFKDLTEDPESTVAVFDEALDRLYDWADTERVWLGP